MKKFQPLENQRLANSKNHRLTPFLALKKCPECSKDVSTQANTCPHCGYPLDSAWHKSDPAITVADPQMPQDKARRTIWRRNLWLAGCLIWLIMFVVIFFIAAVKASETKIDDNIMVTAITILGILVGVYVLGKNEKKKAEEKAQREKKAEDAALDEAKAWIGQVKLKNRINPIQTNMLLKDKEVAYWEEDVSLMETRAVRHYQSGHTGVRIAKGVYIGGSKGYSTSSQEWQVVAQGKLCVTNQRLIFDGDSNARNIPLKKVIAVNASDYTSIEVSTETRQKCMRFSAKNGFVLMMVIRICAQIKDLSDLSSTQVDVAYEE